MNAVNLFYIYIHIYKTHNQRKEEKSVGGKYTGSYSQMGLLSHCIEVKSAQCRKSLHTSASSIAQEGAHTFSMMCLYLADILKTVIRSSWNFPEITDERSPNFHFIHICDISSSIPNVSNFYSRICKILPFFCQTKIFPLFTNK